MCVRDRMKVYIRAEWLINVSSQGSARIRVNISAPALSQRWIQNGNTVQAPQELW
jgi:hypothetical protein